ncbi:carboxymuconolactone decarboxylase family protein [Methanothrix harundinacea]|uniref:Alkylhydroperoxidase like protein, AhpD family n=1 Tax=Methanothrix harundinacea (strain 6Ac) TaxID=1110509 RepID=G7WMX7_METH6|nr:carboxymuconolactone decarboxylase family protein [Methanothrix harundinacea]AET64542.1 Alkylhydroperoxidase like protein, AhpD family [Methanothrix harundinacea 6Ac]
MKEDKRRPYRFVEALGPEALGAFEALSAEVLKDGAIKGKEKALIALASAVAVNCRYCVGAQKRHASMAGASPEEILEAAAVGALVRLGSGFTYASYLLDDGEDEDPLPRGGD